jgi:hypothetical protein
MEKYCKAYPVERFQEFAGWAENSTPIAKEGTSVETSNNGEEPPTAKYLYLHQDYTVTDGIFADEKTVFGEVTPEWVDFCKSVLNFEVPVYESAVSELPKEPSSES